MICDPCLFVHTFSHPDPALPSEARDSSQLAKSGAYGRWMYFIADDSERYALPSSPTLMPCARSTEETRCVCVSVCTRMPLIIVPSNR